MPQNIHALYKKMSLETLVENKLSFNTDGIELNLFETKAKAFDFKLKYNDLSLITMIQGKKVMHLNKTAGFDFLPQESLVLNKYEEMEIDFPEAELDNPTRCMALVISPDEINETLMLLNENHFRSDGFEWSLEGSSQKFLNDNLLTSGINKVISIATSDRDHKDVLGKLAVKELIIGLLQTQARNLLLQSSLLTSNTQLAVAIDYIQKNIESSLDINVIVKKASMSKSSFFRHFKNELGITPNDYILKEKMKRAQQMLKNLNYSISDIAYSLAFSSVSHFIQIFKKYIGVTPGKYREGVL